MLQIGSPKAKTLNEKLNGLDLDGVTFKVESVNGLTLKVSHNAHDDATAKALIKKYIISLPETKNSYTNIQLIDEKGRIL